MTEFGFLVNYSGRAWVTIKAESVEEARVLLLESSCSLEDYATVQNALDFEIEIEKECES